MIKNVVWEKSDRRYIQFIENVTSDEVITLMNMGYKVYRKDMI
jgi:hypothetical protein